MGDNNCGFACTFKSYLFRHVTCELFKSMHSSYMFNTMTVMYFLFNENSSELWVFYLILLKYVYVKQILINSCDSCSWASNIWLFLIHLGTILKNIHFVLFEDFEDLVSFWLIDYWSIVINYEYLLFAASYFLTLFRRVYHTVSYHLLFHNIVLLTCSKHLLTTRLESGYKSKYWHRITYM